MGDDIDKLIDEIETYLHKDDHRLNIKPLVRFGNFKFQGLCKCGWKSDVQRAAGFVHGAHNAHLEEVEKNDG